MKRLKDFVEIDKRFQNSINLQLDLQDDTKLESYCCRFFLHRKMKR